MTALEIVNETIAFYTEDPTRRAVAGNKCVYLTEDGKSCAVGRCFLPDTVFIGPILDTPKDKVNSVLGSVNVLACHSTRGAVFSPEVDAYFQPQYRNQLFDLWLDLQSWHDGFKYWKPDGTGLTPLGQDLTDRLLAKYGDDV